MCPCPVARPTRFEEISIGDFVLTGGELPAILRLLKEANPAVRVCVSAIALETLALAQQSLKELGFADVSVCQIAAARGRKVANYTMMTANNPVFLLTGGGADA